MKVRIRFAKSGAMKYVGHLDIMRYFQKAMRRAQIPIRYSEGFNPHQIMSFAAPLGVGLTSGGEYMDIECTEEIPSAEAVRRLNDTMVEGMEVLSYRYLPDNCENAMASVAAASYLLRYRKPFQRHFTLQDFQVFLRDFYVNPAEIMISKKTKKGERFLDLKPLIYRFDVSMEEDSLVYALTLSTGSTDNIKPELVMEHFHRFIGLEDEEQPALAIHRCDLFTRREDALVSLDEMGCDR